MNNEITRRPLIAAGTALGIGMGGFVDGIVLHQLLQVHNMLSAKYPTRGILPEQLVVNLQINMFWDGLVGDDRSWAGAFVARCSSTSCPSVHKNAPRRANCRAPKLRVRFTRRHGIPFDD
jgi:hypothetical protein